jgi:hypothetical protein
MQTHSGTEASDMAQINNNRLEHLLRRPEIVRPSLGVEMSTTLSWPSRDIRAFDQVPTLD